MEPGWAAGSYRGSQARAAWIAPAEAPAACWAKRYGSRAEGLFAFQERS